MTYEGTFDVVIEGAGARRKASVVAAADGLYIDDHEIPYNTVLGVALRGSILLVVGTQIAAAVRGVRDGLAVLAAELRGHADLAHLAAPDREALEDERVVFSTPVALSGAAAAERVKGLSLAIVSDEALHLLERGGRRMRIPWSTVTGLGTKEAKFGRVLRLQARQADLEVLYLTDAQIQTLRGLAGRHAPRTPPPTREPEARPSGTPGFPEEARRPTRPPRRRKPEPPVTEHEVEEEEVRAAEPADREDTAPAADRPPDLPDIEDPTRHFRVPEFELALGSVGSGADRPLRAALDRMQSSPVLPSGFLEEHLRELRTLYNGALVKRKRAAAAADDLGQAAEALDGEALWNDLDERVGVVVDAMLRAYERQARRLAADRRIPWRRARKKYMPDDREVTGIRQRLARGIGGMQPVLFRLTEVAEQVKQAMGSGVDRLRGAYATWRETLGELDASYAAGWGSLGREIVGVWSESLLPRLNSLAGERRRLLPWPVRLVIYVGLTTMVVALGYLYFTGRLSGLLPPG